MNISRFASPVPVCLFAVMAFGVNSASAVTWGAPTAFTSADSALGQAGIVVGAEAWGGGNTLVTLTGGQTIFFQEGNMNGSDSFVSTAGSYGMTSGNGAEFSDLNPDFQSVLGDFQYDGNQSLTVHNLSVGDHYALQIFGLDDRDFYGSSQEFFSTDPSGNTNSSATFQYNSNSYVIATFTAVSSDQTVYLFSPQNGGSNDGLAMETNLNAIVLFDQTTPEPATWAMLISGFLAIGFKLRRKPALPRAA
jgi:hypothetical protein